MKFQEYPILVALQPYLRKVWAFESRYDVALTDIKTVVPSGHLTLTFTVKGTYSTLVQGRDLFQTRQASLSLIGHQTGPVLLDGGGEVLTVGLSFQPFAAYRFFPFPLQETTNRLVSGEELWGAAAPRLADQLLTLGEPALMAQKLQEFLLEQLRPGRPLEEMARYAVGALLRDRGQLPIHALAQRTGYSQRHLNRLFQEMVGLAPKQFARIVRFKHLLSLPAQGPRVPPVVGSEAFYDQAHFIREFKAFTGHTPQQYAQKDNAFGALFNQLE
ncbi:helix-turn-helix domain-containing protein [Rufibacter psychrotolerans]|uniref:helix-turn-helix domain-containing protein n=1 Tax=Rufibacter psychrotolerans TaxID=2812556 RepID=UPI0019689FF5|nr:helix-turn-helix domain-containing protein [Rufibacter sp. SYSU D00308]